MVDIWKREEGRYLQRLFGSKISYAGKTADGKHVPVWQQKNGSCTLGQLESEVKR